MRSSIRRLPTFSSLALLLLLVGVPRYSGAATFDVFADKDTHVWSLFPDNNFGNFTRNEIGREIGKGETGSAKRALLHFDLSGLPDDTVVTAARIVMFIPEGVGEDLPITVWRLAEGFVEGDGTSGVTWNTQPDVIPSPTYSRTANGSLEVFFGFAPMVIAARESADPDNLWLRIAPTDEITNETHWFGFQTRDDPNSGTNGAAPWLIIDYEVPTSTPTPTATPTVTPTPTLIINPDEVGPPPDIVAPTPDMSVPSTCADAEFLYMGANPIQVGMQPGTIDFEQAAVLRGHVRDAAGADLPGVTVEILAKPMYGYTLTRTNGIFDLAVNGGGLVTLKYSKTDYIPVQRHVNVGWKDCVVAPDVVLLPRGGQDTPITLGPSAPFYVANANLVTDSDGSRQAFLMFQQGTEAQRFVNGVPDPGTLSTIHLTATEFTVDVDGPDRMPGSLPPSSAYTYAIEFDAEEIANPDTDHIEFSKPVSFYLENFLDFPVGEHVPTGYYDRIKGVWVPSEDGRVIEIVGESGGVADVDTDGDGFGDDAATLLDLGFTNDELAALAARLGETLWRVPIRHFTPWDCNWPLRPPQDAGPPNSPDPPPPPPPDDCKRSGSIVGCLGQTLGESVHIVGTPFSLNYQSERVPGYRESRAITIPVGDAPPASVLRTQLKIYIAGRYFERSFNPSDPVTFVWDGLDSYFRPLQGAQVAQYQIGYFYQGRYSGPSSGGAGGNTVPTLLGGGSFSLASRDGTQVTGNIARQEIALWQPGRVQVSIWDQRGLGLGGWSLNVHHAYDPIGKVLYLGDGTRRGNVQTDMSQTGSIITKRAGGYVSLFNTCSHPDDPNVATKSVLNDIRGLAISGAGTIYLSTIAQNPGVICAVNGGHIDVIAGLSTCHQEHGQPLGCGDGGPPIDADLFWPSALAVGPDGLYIATVGDHRVRRIAGGIIETVAGNGSSGYEGDGGPATSAAVNWPNSLAVGPDGSLYIATRAAVRRVSPDGIIHTVAGGAAVGYSGDLARTIHKSADTTQG